MKWATIENIGVDRMASIWLIRRWIDPKAEFIFIPPGTNPPSKAEPFDIPGARYSHYGGHCTFYALLQGNGIKDPILTRIATIVDEADVIQDVNVEPAAAGLDLICRGLRRISADDNEGMERGCLVYDALYEELSSGEI
jgi:hypothetical protein